jgi:hypothetical protein
VYVANAAMAHQGLLQKSDFRYTYREIGYSSLNILS